MDKRAVVLGGHVQGLGIVRALGRNGFQVCVIDQTKLNISRHSRYCSSFFEVNNSDLINYLLSEEGIEIHKGSLLFPTNDEHVEYLSLNKAKLMDYYISAVDDWSVIEKCFNKRKSYKVARNESITIPDTWFPDNKNDLEQVSQKVNYPCIIKPAVMYRFYNSFKSKVFVCKNKDELISAYEKTLQIIPTDEIIIQDIIPGGSEHQYSVGCLFNRVEPIITIAARRRRQHPIDFGNGTTYAETVNEPEIVISAYNILKAIGYEGICEVEFKKDPRDGRFKFLEINPRTWKWHSIADKAETPFLSEYTKMLYGENPNSKNEWKPAAWSHFITDLPVSLRMRLRGVYKKPMVNKPIQAVLEWNDLKPALFEILYLPFLIYTR